MRKKQKSSEEANKFKLKGMGRLGNHVRDLHLHSFVSPRLMNAINSC